MHERREASLTEIERKYADKYNALVGKHNARLPMRQKAEKELSEYRQGEADRIDKAVREMAGKQVRVLENLGKEMPAIQSFLHLSQSL